MASLLYGLLAPTAASTGRPAPAGAAWSQPGGNPDCYTGDPASVISDEGTGISLAECKASCESIPLCADITWAPANQHCILFDKCDEAGPNTGWEHWEAPEPTHTPTATDVCTNTPGWTNGQ